ncbi:ArnT family glycosyltransferase [Halorubrum distributum]|uniref:ArnT family glycosyltransferase n=1 Tax=Halorubrum distributum TaxID=29283 RepID=UPI0009B5C4EE|nr:glycosyltransferase family 39 protein [Halorubrum distributum]
MRFNQKRLLTLIVTVPTLALLPMLTAPVPTVDNRAREIASYFQALAFARNPLSSYTYLTPEESYSALHLHSVLSAPLVELEFLQGGRLIALIGASISALLVAYIGHYYWGDRGLILAPVFLWLSPTFLRFSSRSWPETLSIALTTAVIIGVLRYCSTNERKWHLLALFSLVLAITNHMWEATILLPATAILVYHRRFKTAILTGGVAITTVAVVRHLSGLQPKPSGASSLVAYGVQNHWELLFTADWWFGVSSLHPLSITATLLIPLGCILAIVFTWRAYQEKEEVDVLLSSWLVSALTIPLALPGGAHHWYYVWALTVPIALSGTKLGKSAIEHLTAEYSLPEDRLMYGVVATGLCLMLVYIGVFELGLLAGTEIPLAGAVTSPLAAPLTPMDQGTVEHGSAVQAGQEIKSRDITEAQEIVFVGDWQYSQSQNYFGQAAAARVLIYSDVVVQERQFIGGDNKGPKIATATDSPWRDDCQAIVYRDGENIKVKDCKPR